MFFVVSKKRKETNLVEPSDLIFLKVIKKENIFDNVLESKVIKVCCCRRIENEVMYSMSCCELLISWDFCEIANLSSFFRILNDLFTLPLIKVYIKFIVMRSSKWEKKSTFQEVKTSLILVKWQASKWFKWHSWIKI